MIVTKIQIKLIRYTCIHLSKIGKQRLKIQISKHKLHEHGILNSIKNTTAVFFINVML